MELQRKYFYDKDVNRKARRKYMELRKYIYRVDTDIYLSDNVVAEAKQEGKIPRHYNPQGDQERSSGRLE